MRPGLFRPDWLVTRRLETLLAAEGATIKGVIADIGCGSSPYRSSFPNSSSYLRFDRVTSDPDVMIASADQLPIESGSVDAILATQMLGDLPDLGGTLEEWRRVLQPEGKVIVFETMSYPEHDLPHDYWRVMPNGLQHAAALAGLKVVRVHRIGGLFTRVASLLNGQCFERLARFPLTLPIGFLFIAVSNTVALALDSIWSAPSAAPDYFAVLERE